MSACRKPEQYSIIPKIKLISFEKYIDKSAQLVFSFQDGDGDLGLNDNDIMKPPFDSTSYYHYNFICDYYEKRNGIFVKIDSIKKNGSMEPFNLNSRFPRLSNLPEESINGEIYITQNPYYDASSPYDTIKLSFFIVDRQLHHSDTITFETTTKP